MVSRHFSLIAVISKKKELLEYKIINNNIGYIKVNNSLGDNNLIQLFDKVIDSLMQTNSTILDLSETLGGVNSSIAKAIMGRFTNKKIAYQQHEFDEKLYDTRSSWVEFVTPRKNISRKNLCNGWKVNWKHRRMMAIGLGRMNNMKVIGTQMAGLSGAINNYTARN